MEGQLLLLLKKVRKEDVTNQETYEEGKLGEYHYVSEEKTWSEAQQYCHEHYTDLAFISNQEEVQSKIEAAQTDHVWTGLIFLAREWLWVNRDHLEYQAWTSRKLPHCPAQYLHCGTLTRDEEHWGTRNCEERMNFLCYRA
ncbi:snaclec stejaggregin-B subunit beta-1-like [Salmo trutta]|uniref:snaclec stejaggregin-B subunit beta-1-like n=1 Tax=Salmo trutta TaxID=8032 RepID=UPI0011318B36|nr:snaclec stejaggregin-B subunit beta-1-like [Salmo trutta]